MQNVFPPIQSLGAGGILIWLAAVVGEGFADWQLAQSDPSRGITTGSVAMDSGDTHAIRICL